MLVKYFPYQAHCFAFGGFDLQMLNTMEAVNTRQEIASKLDIWSRDDNFDIIHLWGMTEHAFKTIEWSKKKQKKLVATVLLPYFETVYSKLSYYYHRSSAYERRLRYFYSLLDAVAVLNDLQAEVVNKYYNVPEAKIFIIPNVVNVKFFKPCGDIFVKKYKIDDYVLCTGNICSRKNQYNLAVACIDLNINLVLIGSPLDGEQEYAGRLESLINGKQNIIWVRELSNDSEEYLSAYANCRLFSLASHDETQPISALEAVAMGKSLIMQNKAYAKQKYYLNAELSRSGSPEDIKEALNCALEKSPTPNSYILDCQSDRVGEMYNEIYRKILVNK